VPFSPLAGAPGWHFVTVADLAVSQLVSNRGAVECSRSMSDLTYVDPSRSRSLFTRGFVLAGTTRPARFVSRHVLWHLDPLLLRLTRGRASTAFPIRTAVLETRGARSNATRRNAVIYFHDGDKVTIVASHAGYPRHPAWYHNLRAHPDVTLGATPMRANVVSDEAERQRLWTAADRVFPPYAKYRRQAAKAGRTIPLVQLTAR
jgi:deazaflavin-dependent oxidoreductase (nitroreductase family)